MAIAGTHNLLQSTDLFQSLRGYLCPSSIYRYRSFLILFVNKQTKSTLFHLFIYIYIYICIFHHYLYFKAEGIIEVYFITRGL